jgi:hypothetical protein
VLSGHSRNYNIITKKEVIRIGSGAASSDYGWSLRLQRLEDSDHENNNDSNRQSKERNDPRQQPQ